MELLVELHGLVVDGMYVVHHLIKGSIGKGIHG